MFIHGDADDQRQTCLHFGFPQVLFSGKCRRITRGKSRCVRQWPLRVDRRRPFRSQEFRVRARSRSGRSRLRRCAGCSRGSALSFAPRRAPGGIESAQVRLRQRGRAEHRSVAYAARGIIVAMPNPGLCRIHSGMLHLAAGRSPTSIIEFGIVRRSQRPCRKASSLSSV
jgi:hypothetical protein